MGRGGKKNTRRTRASQPAGANPRAHPKYRRWAVDFDYTQKLSREELEWLSKFSDSYYGGDFSDDEDGEWDLKSRREAYKRNNYARGDAYALASVGGCLEFDSDNPGKLERLEAGETVLEDDGVDDAYLNSPEYKQALIEYRATLNERANPAAPKQDLRHRWTKHKLEEVVKRGQRPKANSGSDEPKN